MERTCDVVVIGGGPAGLSACLELSKKGALKIALFENESTLGGIPGSAHFFFGMRDLWRVYRGPVYARKLSNLIKRTSVEVHTLSTVINIHPDAKGEQHRIVVASPKGIFEWKARAVLLATGCYEASRESRLIAGSRPAGVFTTGSLQKLVNLKGLKPGNRAVILGSEHVSFSSALTLRHAGVPIECMVEAQDQLQSYPTVARALGVLMRLKILKDFSVKAIGGDRRVEGIHLVNNVSGKSLQLPCDTVIVTGSFRPDSQLIIGTAISEDPATCGPLVDSSFQTTVSNIFCAGNILHGADMHDVCALEGRRAARNILENFGEKRGQLETRVSVRADAPIRYVVPQKILPKDIRTHRSTWFQPGCSIQISKTLKEPTLMAFSGDQLIWKFSYSRCIANTRIPIPLEKFDWERVDLQKGILLRVSATNL